jgi:hypothetical protein
LDVSKIYDDDIPIPNPPPPPVLFAGKCIRRGNNASKAILCSATRTCVRRIYLDRLENVL